MSATLFSWLNVDVAMAAQCADGDLYGRFGNAGLLGQTLERWPGRSGFTIDVLGDDVGDTERGVRKSLVGADKVEPSEDLADTIGRRRFKHVR